MNCDLTVRSYTCFAGIILDALVINFDVLMNQTSRFLTAIYTNIKEVLTFTLHHLPTRHAWLYKELPQNILFVAANMLTLTKLICLGTGINDRVLRIQQLAFSFHKLLEIFCTPTNTFSNTTSLFVFHQQQQPAPKWGSLKTKKW